MTSKRPRVRPYAWMSLLRLMLPSNALMFFVYVPTMSINPVIVTFGAGACAIAGATSPRTATRATASTNSLLITASSKRVSCSNEPLCAAWADSHNRSRPRTTAGYTVEGPQRQVETTLSCRALTSLPQGSETLEGRLAEGGLGSDLPRAPEQGFGLLRTLVGGQDEPEVVIGGLELGLEAQGEAQRLLGLAVAAEVEQRQAQVLMRQVHQGQRGQGDRLAIGGDRVFPASGFGKGRAEVEMGVAAARIELHRLRQLGERLIDASEVEQHETEGVAIERGAGVEVGGLRQRGQRQHRLALVELAQGPLVGVLRLQPLHLGHAAGAAGEEHRRGKDEAKPALH